MTNVLHIDDDGCLCETCAIVQATCDTWKYVVMMQEETHDRALLYTKEPEVTLKMNIAKCAGYHKKEEGNEVDPVTLLTTLLPLSEEEADKLERRQ